MVVRQIPKLVAGLVLLRPRWPIGENEQASEPERARGGGDRRERREGGKTESVSQSAWEGGTEGGRGLYTNWQRAHRRSETAGVRSRLESRVGHVPLHPVLHTRPNQSIIPAWAG